MTSANVIVLPSGEVAARQRFAEILNQPSLLFVVLGDGQKENAAADRADRMAGTDEDPCRVVWAKQPSHVQDQLAALGFTGDGRSAVAVSLSLQHEVRDVIEATEEPGYFRILQSLAKAMA